MIAGMLNESVPSYFEDNIDSFYRDFDQLEVRRFFPSSDQTMKENAPLVAAWLRQTWEDFGKRPLLLMPHSKGAAEVLLAVLRDPTLISRGIIDKIILVQPA